MVGTRARPTHDLPEDVQQLLGWTSYEPPAGNGGRLWMVDFDALRETLVSEFA